LKVNNTLTHLNMSRINIGNEGARELADALKVNNTLTHLNLSGTNIGDEGASALADALKVNNTLTSLGLDGNDIGNDGASELADALKGNNTLTNLYLWNNNVGNEGASAVGAIGELISRNNLLKLHSDVIETQRFPFYFGANDNAETTTLTTRLTNYVSKRLFGRQCIKETVWKAATTGDGLVLGLVQDVLQKHLAEVQEDDLTSKKESFKKLFNEGRNAEGSPLLHVAAALDSKEALGFCQFLVNDIGVDFDTIRDKAGLTARDIAEGNATMSDWAKSVGSWISQKKVAKWSSLHEGMIQGKDISRIQQMIKDSPPEQWAETDWDGRTPLHLGMLYCAATDNIKALLDAYPGASEMLDRDNRTPLHLGMISGAPVATIKVLLDAYPRATKIPDIRGFLPLISGRVNGAPIDSIDLIFSSYPEAEETCCEAHPVCIV